MAKTQHYYSLDDETFNSLKKKGYYVATLVRDLLILFDRSELKIKTKFSPKKARERPRYSYIDFICDKIKRGELILGK